MSPYRIETEEYVYTYRSYMASEDQAEDDCSAIAYRYIVYRGNRKLKVHHSIYNAKQHVLRLTQKNKAKK